MKDLIEALQIFLKYTQDRYPTNCNHDELRVSVDPTIVSEEDITRLEQLGFVAYHEDFISYRFGSC